MTVMLMIMIFSQQKHRLQLEVWSNNRTTPIPTEMTENKRMIRFWVDSTFLSGIGFFRAGAAMSVETSRRKLKCENVHLQVETHAFTSRIYHLLKGMKPTKIKNK